METDAAHEEWVRSVQRALGREDTDALAALFAHARDVWGSERASRMWWETVSAFDANALTG